MAFVNLPPNLQDIFNGIYDRLAKLETGPNQPLYVAESAQFTASSAQTTAAQALTEATQALIQAQGSYVIASQAIIKSAQTITNAQNQLTAMNTNGITVYSGASATSGARVLMNSLGIVGYNSSNNPTFTLDATNGNVSMTGALFSQGTISGGSLNINGNAIITSAGYLTAYGATIQGTITANAGSFTGNIYGGTGNIGGWYFNSTGLYNPALTASIDASNGAISNLTTNYMTKLILNGASSSSTDNLAVSGDVNITGSMAMTGTATVQTNLNVNASVTFGTSNQFQYLSSSGTLRSVYTYGKAVTGRAMQINSAGDFGTTASTLRKKHEVQDYAIDTSKLLSLKVKTFKYLPEIDEAQEQQYGFIAEQAESLGLQELVLYNDEGQVDYFAYEKLPIFLLQLAQEQDAKIKALETRVTQLENPV